MKRIIGFIRRLLGKDRCLCGEYMGYTPGCVINHLRCLPKTDHWRIAAERDLDEMLDDLFEPEDKEP